jgi:hypothetical protein
MYHPIRATAIRPFDPRYTSPNYNVGMPTGLLPARGPGGQNVPLSPQGVVSGRGSDWGSDGAINKWRWEQRNKPLTGAPPPLPVTPGPMPLPTPDTTTAVPSTDAEVAASRLSSFGKGLGALGPHLIAAGAPTTDPSARGKYISQGALAFQKAISEAEATREKRKLQGLEFRVAEQKLATSERAIKATKALADRYRKAGKPLLANAIEAGDTEIIKALLKGKGSLDSNQLVSQEFKLREDFEKTTKIEKDQIAAYSRIEAIYRDPVKNKIREFQIDDREVIEIDADGAADLVLIFNFMKMLDPNSVVRESEFQLAGKTGGLPGWLKLQVIKVTGGELLTTQMRKKIMRQARNQFDVAATRYGEKLGRAKARVATYASFGISGERVLSGTAIYKPQLERTVFEMVGGAKPKINIGDVKTDEDTGDSWKYTGGDPNKKESWRKL